MLMTQYLQAKHHELGGGHTFSIFGPHIFYYRIVCIVCIWLALDQGLPYSPDTSKTDYGAWGVVSASERVGRFLMVHFLKSHTPCMILGREHTLSCRLITTTKT
jgi:hypothetical protein